MKKRNRKDKKGLDNTANNVDHNIITQNAEFTTRDTLNFSERKDRFLVVTTVMTALVIALVKLMSVSEKIMGQVYINKSTIFGNYDVSLADEHFVSVFLVVGILLMFVKFLVYCIFEAMNFTSGKVDKEKADWADKFYIEVFYSLFRYMAIFMYCGMIISIIFNGSKILFYVVTAGTILLLGIYTYYFLKIKKIIKTIWSTYIKPFLLDLIIIGALFIFVLLITLSIANNVIGLGTFKFEKETIHAIFEGNDVPDEIQIRIVGGEGEIVKTYLVKEDFTLAFIETASFNKYLDQEEEMMSPKFNQYYYKMDIDFSDSYKKGENIIIITYEVDGKKFKIRNTVNIEEDYQFAKESLAADY